MTAHKAPNTKAKKSATGDPSLKVSTFRLGSVHRQALNKYALALGQSMDPPKVVNQTVALQHMILNTPLPTQTA